MESVRARGPLTISRGSRIGHRLGKRQVERFVGHGFDSRDDDRQVFRRAAGHNRIDRDFYDRRLSPQRRDAGNDPPGIPAAGKDSSLRHGFLGRREDRQPIRPPALEILLVDLSAESGSVILSEVNSTAMVFSTLRSTHEPFYLPVRARMT